MTLVYSVRVIFGTLPNIELHVFLLKKSVIFSHIEYHPLQVTRSVNNSNLFWQEAFIVTVAVDLKNVWKRFGDFIAVKDVTISILDGEFFSLLGPSGCGKTTTLRMIAGFDLPTQGEIFLHGKPVGQLPPFKRDVNTVFQRYALFPHLTIAQNVAFGLEMKKVAKPEIEERVRKALEMVKLGNKGNNRPAQLSGGQMQRVALARAIVNRPEVLLLDEPLGALDLKLRKEMQFELKRLQRELGLTFIYVTHDQEEALVMSDRIGVMSDGLLLQVGTPAEIYNQPNCRFVADFIGETNFVNCHVSSVDAASKMAHVKVAGQFDVHAGSADDVVAGKDAFLAIRPEKISIHLTAGSVPESHDNVFDAKIVEDIFIGTDTRYVVELAGNVRLAIREQNMSALDATDPYDVGTPVKVSWDSDSARILMS